MNFDWRQLFNVFSRMSTRERTLVSLALAGLVIAGLYSAIDWLDTRQEQVVRQMKHKEQDLQKLAQLRYEYLDLSQKLTAGETMLAKTSKDFSLFAFLESTISQVTPGRISSMNRSNKTTGDQYEEEMVEFKLTQVTLENIVDMLHRIEKGDNALRVTRLMVKERTGATHDFDVTATVSLVRSLHQKDERPAAPAAPAPVEPEAPPEAPKENPA